MKYIGIGLIWLGYAGAIAAMTFNGVADNMVGFVGFFGVIGATISTVVIAVSK